MKRCIFLILLAAMLFVAASAFADSEGLPFNATCWYKLSKDVTLYVEVNEGEPLTAVQTLPAGTYVRPTGDTKEGKSGIGYLEFGIYGYVDGSAITSCATYVSVNGSTYKVPEAAARYRPYLNAFLEAEYGVSVNGTGYTDSNGVWHEFDLTEEELAALEGEAKFLSASAKAARKNGYSTPTVYRDEEGNEISVKIVSLGLARSKVLLNGKEELVDTCRLSWETEAPEDKVLAVVTPKNASDVRLRTAKSEKATIMARVQTTRVVQVIRIEKGWTLVDTNDDLLPRGYISTSVLTFYSNAEKAYRPAVIAVNGSTRGKGEDNLVRIREKGSRKGREIAKFDLGEPLSVFQGESGSEWLEVDVGGFHAYIQSQFVTYTAETGAPSAAAGESETGNAEEPSEDGEIEEVRGKQLISP